MNKIKQFLRKIKSAFVKSSENYGVFYERCKTKPDYFVEKCLILKNSSDDSFISLRPYQAHVLQNVMNFNRTIFEMPRQSSKSLLVILSALHYATFNKDVRVVVMTPKHISTQRLFLWLKDIICESGKFRALTDVGGQIGSNFIWFNNGSRITFTNVINEPYDFLLLDEFAFFGTNATKILEELKKHNKKVAIFSTPNHTSVFNKLFADSYNFNEDTGFVPMTVSFKETVINSKECINNLGFENFKKEFIGLELHEPL